jgi:hypothetical protein
MESQPEVDGKNLRPPPTAATAAATVLASVKVDEQPEPGTPPLPVPMVTEEWRRPLLFPYELLGGAALVLAGIAIVAAVLPGLQTLAAACAGLAIAIGGAGLIAAAKPERGGRLKPAIAVALGGAILLVTTQWPNLLVSGPPLGNNAPHPLGADAPEPGGAKLSDSPPDMNLQARSYRSGALWLQVVSVTVGPVKFASGASPAEAERGLQIVLRVCNASTERPMRYLGWSRPISGDSNVTARLLDNHAKAYALRSFGSGKTVPDQVRNLTLAPVGRTDDLLVFEIPSVIDNPYTVELPLAAVGGTGTIRLDVIVPPAN